MFGKRITLFKLFGFAVRIDISWFLLALFVVWSLAVAYFPQQYKGLSQSAYWWMGIGGALGLFVSIVFHELCHSLVARRYDLPMKGITLFIFGGVAEMDKEPPSAKAEFMMSIAGPISSILLGALCYALYALGTNMAWPEVVTAVLWWVALINWVLAGFNLLPAFPLDGGRVLRSILWAIRGKLRWATRVTSQLGGLFGLFLIMAGIYFAFAVGLVAGLWWIFIGMFLRGAASQSYQQLLLRQALQGESIREFMNEDPVTVSPPTTIDSLVEDYIYRYHHKMFPVVENDELKGCVTLRQVKEVPREQWNEKTVGDIAEGCSSENTVDSDADAMDVLAAMNRTQISRLMVVDDGRLVGIISLKDMLKFLSLKIELEEEEEPAGVSVPIKSAGAQE